MVSTRWAGVVLCGAMGLAPEAALAQDTSRTDEIAAAQAEKAKQLHPYRPDKVEEVLTRLVGARADPPAVSPIFDSAHAGGSFTPGVLVRRMYADRSIFAARALYSVKQYKLFEAGTAVPGLLRGRVTLSARGGWRDATQVGYYGLGPDTSKDDRANYRFQQTFIQGRAEIRPVWWLPISGGAAYERYDLKSGKGSDPSIETVYTPVTAPGLGASPTFVHTDARGGLDTRRPGAGYARRGGYYGLAYHNYADTGDVFSFDRLDGEAIQHIPVLRETWIVSLRARVQSTLGDDLVPYFMLPALGGGSSLRGFSSWRFRDRHSLLTNIEWRWIPNRLGFDMAVFYDAGKVADRLDALTLRHMATDWGIGSRFHVPDLTVLRIEVARGDEGWHLIFSSSAIF